MTTLSIRDVIYITCDLICVPSLRSLQHYTGGYYANLPWSLLRTVAVDRIPDGTRCDMLEEVTILDVEVSIFHPMTTTNFKNIHCPKLTSVWFPNYQSGIITDYFTHDQLNQLTTFKGANIRLDDLTLLEHVEVLAVQCADIITEDTPLSPHLVDLSIVSFSSVEGIPRQLTAFEFISGNDEADVMVTSTTLKRLLIWRAARVKVDCPQLEDLGLGLISTIVECNTPNISMLSLCKSSIPFESFPNLRQLFMEECTPYAADIVIGQHLDFVTLDHMRLGKVKFSANKGVLKSCTFTQTPKIEARVLESGLTVATASSVESYNVPLMSGSPTWWRS